MIKRIDRVVWRETKYVFLFSLFLSLFMQGIFLAAGKWSAAVLAGNICGAATAVGNFLWMGLSVQRAVQKDENGAEKVMRRSRLYRGAAVTAAAVFCAAVGCSLSTLLIPLFFPRMAFYVRPLIERKAVSDGMTGRQRE